MDGYASFSVKLLTLRQSRQTLTLPGLVTITIGEDQALSDSSITPNRNHPVNFSIHRFFDPGETGNAVASQA